MKKMEVLFVVLFRHLIPSEGAWSPPGTLFRGRRTLLVASGKLCKSVWGNRLRECFISSESRLVQIEHFSVAQSAHF